MNPLNIGNLKVNLPIIQGGMGVAVSLSGLASAVANDVIGSQQFNSRGVLLTQQINLVNQYVTYS